MRDFERYNKEIVLIEGNLREKRVKKGFRELLDLFGETNKLFKYLLAGELLEVKQFS